MATACLRYAYICLQPVWRVQSELFHVYSSFFFFGTRSGAEKKQHLFLEQNCMLAIQTFHKWHEYFMKSLVSWTSKEDFVTSRELRLCTKQRSHSVLLASSVTVKICACFISHETGYLRHKALEPLWTGLLPHSHLTDRPLQCFWCYHKLQRKFAFLIQIEKMTKYVKEYINRNNTVRQLRHHLCLIWPTLSFFCPKLWAHFGRIWDCNHSAVTCVSERHHVKVRMSNQSFFSSQDQHESA